MWCASVESVVGRGACTAHDAADGQRAAGSGQRAAHPTIRRNRLRARAVRRELDAPDFFEDGLFPVFCEGPAQQVAFARAAADALLLVVRLLIGLGLESRVDDLALVDPEDLSVEPNAHWKRRDAMAHARRIDVPRLLSVALLVAVAVITVLLLLRLPVVVVVIVVVVSAAWGQKLAHERVRHVRLQRCKVGPARRASEQGVRGEGSVGCGRHGRHGGRTAATRGKPSSAAHGCGRGARTRLEVAGKE